MKNFPNIRNLYQPIQPTVTSADANVSYTEFMPDEKLLPFIYCYWELKTETQLAEKYLYRVIADGCVDIFFPLENPDESYIMGFCKSYTEFSLGKQFHYIGIRFLPMIFPLMFRQNAKELNHTEVPLEEVIPLLAKYISFKINMLQTFQQIKTLLDIFFLKHLEKNAPTADHRFYNAIERILKTQGNLHILKDLDTGISPRQLRRLFEFYIGDTAKTFSQVVRFQSVINGKTSVQALCKNNFFLDLYYDQSHFIKEFKQFYGATPREVLGRKD